MACDIHARFYHRASSESPLEVDHLKTNIDTYTDWVEVECGWEQTANYLLFSVLAGVRNVSGTVIPISEPRGLPAYFEKLDGETSPRGDWIWFGDHSQSWLAIDELLHWKKTTGTTGSFDTGGIVSRDFFMSWDGVSEPPEDQRIRYLECHSTAVKWDGKFLPSATPQGSIIDPTDGGKLPNDWKAITIEWRERFSDMFAENFWAHIEKLKADYPTGDLIMVFGFDN